MDAETRSGRIDIGLRQRPRAEVVAFGKLMAALAMMKSKDPLIGFQVEVFEDATVDVPITIIAKAVSRYMRMPDTWRPDAGTFLQMCESLRLEARGALKHLPCVDCETSPGWRATGDRTVQRCPCWIAHQQKVQDLGVGDQPLALPAARYSDWTSAGDGDAA